MPELSGVSPFPREAHESYVCYHQKFKTHAHLDSGFSGLCELGCLACGGAEMVVSQTSPASLEEYKALYAGKVLDDLSSICIFDDGSRGNRNLHVLARSAVAACAASVAAVLRTESPDDLQMSQGSEVVLHDEDKVPALSAVTAVRTALLDEFQSWLPVRRARFFM